MKTFLMTLLSFAAATMMFAVSASPALADDVGAEKFKLFCSSCHGETGKGDGAAAVALDPKPADFSSPDFFKTRDDAHLTKVITEGGPAVGKSALMAPWGAALKPEEIQSIIKYIKTFTPKK